MHVDWSVISFKKVNAIEMLLFCVYTILFENVTSQL